MTWLGGGEKKAPTEAIVAPDETESESDDYESDG
jgi:hypothetical protein